MGRPDLSRLKPKWLQAGLARLGGLLLATPVLAVEVTSERLLGAVVRGRGRQIELVDFAALERRQAGEDLPDIEDLRVLVQRLNYAGQALVLSTPLARSVQMAVNAQRVRSLTPYRLAESLRWEVEPYTGIGGMQALVAVEPVARGEDLALALEQGQDVDVQLAVMERNALLALKRLCRRAGLRLRRVYPPDSCFYVPVAGDEGAQAVLDVGADFSSFVVLQGRQPLQIATYPVGLEVLRELVRGEAVAEVEQSLRYLLQQVPAPAPLLITGAGAQDAGVLAWLDGQSPTGARSLALRRVGRLTSAAHDGQNALFATAVGAAWRELGGRRWRQAGLTDVPPLVVRLRDSAYLMPLVVAALLAVTLFGHYEWMVLQKRRYDARIVELGREVAQRKDKDAEYKKKKTESEALTEEITLFKKRIAFVEGGSDGNLQRQLDVLLALALVPENTALSLLEQLPDGQFRLEGLTGRPDSLSRFALALQRQPWCAQVVVESLEQGSGGFDFRLRLEPADA